MNGPTRGLTPEETTLFIAELEQRLSEATGEDRERLSQALSIWLRMVSGVAPAMGGQIAAGSFDGSENARPEKSA